MITTSTSSTSGKTPFDAIREAEDAAQTKIDAEEAKLRKELEDAANRNQVHLDEKRAALTEKASAELKEQKAAMTNIIAEFDQEGEKECHVLRQKAATHMDKVLTMLHKHFLSQS